MAHVAKAYLKASECLQRRWPSGSLMLRLRLSQGVRDKIYPCMTPWALKKDVIAGLMKLRPDEFDLNRFPSNSLVRVVGIDLKKEIEEQVLTKYAYEDGFENFIRQTTSLNLKSVTIEVERNGERRGLVVPLDISRTIVKQGTRREKVS